MGQFEQEGGGKANAGECPDHEPERFGVEEAVPRSYLGQLVYPFMPARWKMGMKQGQAGGLEAAGRAEEKPAAEKEAVSI